MTAQDWAMTRAVLGNLTRGALTGTLGSRSQLLTGSRPCNEHKDSAHFHGQLLSENGLAWECVHKHPGADRAQACARHQRATGLPL
jgi:hypothetical protein